MQIHNDRRGPQLGTHALMAGVYLRGYLYSFAGLILLSSCGNNTIIGDPLKVIKEHIQKLESAEVKKTENSLEYASLMMGLYRLNAHRIRHLSKQTSDSELVEALKDKSGKLLLDSCAARISGVFSSDIPEVRLQAEKIAHEIASEKYHNMDLRCVKSDNKFVDSLITLGYLEIMLEYDRRNRDKLPAYVFKSALANVADCASNKEAKEMFEALSKDEKTAERELSIDIFMSPRMLFEESIHYKGLAVKNAGITLKEQITLYFKAMVHCICIVEIHRPQKELLDAATSQLKSLITLLEAIDGK